MHAAKSAVKATASTDEPLTSAKPALSRGKPAATFLRRSQSPPPQGPYTTVLAAGTSAALPQPSSQRSQRSEQPPHDAGDLREYSTANAIPIATFVRAQRWRLYGSSPTSCTADVGSPRQDSTASRCGGVLGSLSRSNASRGGSMDSPSIRSTCSAAFAGNPVRHDDVTYADVRTLTERWRPPWPLKSRQGMPAQSYTAVRSHHAQHTEHTQRTCTTTLSDAGVDRPGCDLRGHADSNRGAKVFEVGVSSPSTMQACSRAHLAQPQGLGISPIQGVLGADNSDGGGQSTQHEPVSVEGGRPASGKHRRNQAVRGLSSVRVPHSTQHGAEIGPHEVSLAGADIEAPIGSGVGRHDGGTPSSEVPTAAGMLRGGSAQQAAQRRLLDQALQGADRTATATTRDAPQALAIGRVRHAARDVAGDVELVNHITQRDDRVALPGDGGIGAPTSAQVERATSSSSSSLNTSPRVDAKSVRQPSTSDSARHSTQHEQPPVAASGVSSPFPGAIGGRARAVKVEKRVGMVRASETFAHEQRQRHREAAGQPHGRPAPTHALHDYQQH